MPKLIETPTVITAAGNMPKRIEEFVGRVNSKTDAISIARMKSPSGWVEPGQTPEFDEYTVVLRGLLRVTTRTGSIDVKEGQAIITRAQRMGPVQHSGTRRRRIYRGLSAGIFARGGPSGQLTKGW